MYDPRDDKRIKTYNSQGVGVRSMSWILGCYEATIIRRILYLASKITKPIYSEHNEVYEVDEMWTFIGSKNPSSYSWITHAINRRTCHVIDVAFGSRNKQNLKQVIDSVKSHNPKKIVTDKLIIYPNLVRPVDHETNRYSNNRIEQGNLTLRTHIKRLWKNGRIITPKQLVRELCEWLSVRH